MKVECLSIVFVDIKDYTSKTSGQSRTANERLLTRFGGLVRPVVKAFHGTVVKGIGDAFLITFRSPTDSVLCAMAVQDHLANRNAQFPPEERFDVRFGINAGEVRVDAKDVFGDAVNIASRIEGLAQGGDIWFSDTVFQMMNKSEVPVEAVGPTKLKGIREEIRLYRVPRLGEVGTYKLPAQKDSRARRFPPPIHALPYGGLALNRVRAHVTGMALEADGSLYLAGALSEIHYTAVTRSVQVQAKSRWLKSLAPGLYLAFASAAAADILSRHRVYRGVAAWARKSFRLLRRSASYRRKAALAALLGVLVLGASVEGWRRVAQYRQAKATASQAEQTASEHAKSRDGGPKEPKKAKNKIRFPW